MLSSDPARLRWLPPPPREKKEGRERVRGRGGGHLIDPSDTKCGMWRVIGYYICTADWWVLGQRDEQVCGESTYLCDSGVWRSRTRRRATTEKKKNTEPPASLRARHQQHRPQSNRRPVSAHLPGLAVNHTSTPHNQELIPGETVIGGAQTQPNHRYVLLCIGYSPRSSTLLAVEKAEAFSTANNVALRGFQRTWNTSDHIEDPS